MPENENGKPEIETLVDQGPSLNDSEQLKYYLSKLYKMSKIPESRFDKENAAAWFGTDPTQTLRDEINFGRFVDRLRNVFSMVIIKPIQIQVALSIPEMKNDKRVLDAIIFRYNSYNQFTEMMDLEVTNKRLETIGMLKDTFTTTDAEGNEDSYFSMRFLLERYLKMSDADFEYNQKCKWLEKQENGDAESEEEENGEEEMSGMDSGSEDAGMEDDGSEDAGGDSEMMGDVQPDNSAEGGSGEM